MKTAYRHGEKIEGRRLKADVLIVGVILLIVGLVSAYLYLDVREQVVIDENENRPQVLNTSDNKDFTIFEDETYRVSLPGVWERYDPDYQAIRGKNGAGQNHYRVVEPGQEGRTLDIFVDDIPTDEKVSRLLPVAIDDGKIRPGTISDQCLNFTQYEKFGVLVPAKWQGHEFLCDTSEYANTIGVVATNMNDGIQLTGPTTGEHQYLIIYTDHGRNPDNTLFFEILEKFEPL